MSLFYYLFLPVLYAVTFVLPFYKTFKAVQKAADSSSSETKESPAHWLKFWMLAALSNQIFVFYERLFAGDDYTQVSLVYLIIKAAWFYWLSLPQGSTLAYQYAIVPTLVQHEAQVDQWFSHVTHLVNTKSQTFLNNFQNQRQAGRAAPQSTGSNPNLNKKRDQ